MNFKTTRRRGAALGLSLLMTLTAAAAPALASDALGSFLKGGEDQLATGVTLTDSSMWSASRSDLRTEYYFTYTPNETVTPLVWYGAEMDELARLSDAAAGVAARGYRVVAGVNGGFFNPDSTPVGLVVTDGVIRTIDGYNAVMIGFQEDGSAFFDQSTVQKTVSWTSWEGLPVQWELTAVNASRQNGKLYLFNEDFGPTTQNTYPGVDVLLDPVVPGEKPIMEGEVRLTVTGVVDSTQAGVRADNLIPPGGYVLSANKNCDERLLNDLRALQPGTEVTLRITGADPRWTTAVSGITGLYRLVKDGAAVTGELAAGAAPRTALGLRADGTVLLYVIDGRQAGYSVGASYTQTAQRLIELGCVQAAALDGGGSTTLGATLPGGVDFTVLNSPSGGNQRKVSTCLFLVTDTPAARRAERIFVQAENDVVLAGGRTRVTAAAADANGYPVRLSGKLHCASTGGTVEQDAEGAYVFTAGREAGAFEVGASAGSVWGSTPVQVVRELSSLTVTRGDTGLAVKSLDLLPGEEVELDAHGLWRNLPVAMDDANVIWTAAGGIGSLDENGHFTATAGEGTGMVTAEAGGRTVTIEVEVKRNDPFTDLAGHWSRPYVLDLYDLGMVNGVEQADGTFQYQPDGMLTRGEVLTYISRLIGADTALYEDVELHFADLAEVREWQIPCLKAMVALRVFKGDLTDGVLTAQMDQVLTREAILTLLGRVLAEQVEYSLDGIPDSADIHPWCVPYIQTLAARGVISGTAPLGPQEGVTRGEMAMLVVQAGRLPLIQPGQSPIF